MLSDSLKNVAADAAIKTNLNLFAVSYFNGPVPVSPSDIVTGTLLAKFTVNNDGVTGGTFSSSVGGICQRNIAESMSATCLANGSPTFYRVHRLADSATSANTGLYRSQGTCGVVGAESVLDSSFFPMVLGQVYPLQNVAYSF